MTYAAVVGAKVFVFGYQGHAVRARGEDGDDGRL